MGDLYAEEHRQAISQLVQNHRRAHALELASRFEVTPETVRRDVPANTRNLNGFRRGPLILFGADDARSRSAKSLKVSLLLALVATYVLALASPAVAVCQADKSNEHTLGEVFHGWSRLFCQPENNFLYQAKTNHGHGTKYLAFWHDGATMASTATRWRV